MPMPRRHLYLLLSEEVSRVSMRAAKWDIHRVLFRTLMVAAQVWACVVPLECLSKQNIKLGVFCVCVVLSM
jgi:hypothetical protein